MKNFLLNISLAAMISGGVLAAEELVLVEDGVSLAPIVVAEDAPPRTVDAAEELAGYLERISGARPELIEGRPEPLPNHAIWVGYQDAVGELFPDANFDFAHPEEVLILSDSRHLVIAGRDVWDPEHEWVQYAEGRGNEIPVQFEYGTANAVYTFLRDQLGVRWFWPGQIGEHVPESETITLAPVEYRHHPQFRYRGGFFHSPMRTFRYGRDGDSQEWLKFQRLALGSLDMNAAGHGFGDWWERFHESHPEYFALQPDGTRSGFPNPRTVKMCHSNPNVAKQWLADVEAELEQNPTARVFNASPNDSGASGHCICENCRAMDHPDAELLNFRWEGLVQDYVAVSDRHILFANECARLLKERFPDRDYYVLMLAYGNWRPAPIEAVPDDNVIISNVANMFWNVDQETAVGSPAQQYADWGRVTDKQVWRPNTGSPVGWQQGFPDIPIRRNAEVIKFAAEHGGIGASVDMVWEYWATQGPLYYVAAQLMWDPDQDVDEILADYYQHAFGPAAEPVRAYWELMEKTRNTFSDTVGTWRIEGNYANLPKVYNDELFDRAGALLDEAAELAAEGPEIYGQRVAFVRAGLDYTRLAMEGRAFLDRYIQSDGTDEEAKKFATEKWEAIIKIQEAHPDNFRWYRLAGSRNPLNADFLPPISPRFRD